MAQFSVLKTGGELRRAVAQLLSDLIRREVVRAALVPTRQRHGHVVMQTLIADPEQLDRIDPLAPVAWCNAGTLAAALTFDSSGPPVAMILRSCEARALIELAKLHQAQLEGALIIGLDCLGRYQNQDFVRLAQAHEDPAEVFLRHATGGATPPLIEGVEIARACQACEYPVAPNADLRLCLIGADLEDDLWIEGASQRGIAALSALGLPLTDQPPAGRAAAVRHLEGQRIAFRDQLLAQLREKTGSIDGLMAATAGCINCYNCRVACPVCYCRQCVFTTDTFRHDSENYLQRSRKQGMLKLPTDTLFYHLTRMVHISTLCVGCGQCSSACPNDIPVMELLRIAADATQARFEYRPGRDPHEAQPLATFHESEFEDATASPK